MKQNIEQWCPEYVTTGFVAAHCGVCNVTVLRWIGKKRLSAFRLPDGHYRVHREDFANFATRYRIPLHHNTAKGADERSGE